jgi:predicted AlkP superfamily pyrophosphatase or phosphodiesterase
MWAMSAMRALFLGFLALLGAPSGRVYDRVLLISVDGLRSDALLVQDGAPFPAFTRLLHGAGTLNARTDPDYTVTLPNHTSMLTGRPVLGTEGHAWIENEDPPPGATLASNKGSYVAGIFDVAHDRGVRTAMLVGKTKFSLYDESWDAEHGAPDAVPPDDGRKKIDVFLYVERTADLGDAILRELTGPETKRDAKPDANAKEPANDGTSVKDASPAKDASKDARGKRLVFAHFAATDLTAHAYGWDVTPGSKYLKALAAIDREIGRVLDAIEKDDALRGRTAVILTADHGGGAPFKSHEQTRFWVDYVIPFLVWTGDGGRQRDLYELNAATRRDPGITQPKIASGLVVRGEGKNLTAELPLPPIRNGDSGNLALSLLGLPSVPGSTLNAAQDLRIEPRE